jgi:hypothetical protein
MDIPLSKTTSVLHINITWNAVRVIICGRALQCCEELHHFTRLLFSQNRPPEQLYRTCEGVLSLYKKTDKDQFKKACTIAIAHEKYSSKFILSVIENNLDNQDSDAHRKSLPDHDNIRGGKYYS